MLRNILHYGSLERATVTASDGVSPSVKNLKTDTDGGEVEFTYSGDATVLTFTIDGGSIYVHGLKVSTEQYKFKKAENPIYRVFGF